MAASRVSPLRPSIRLVPAHSRESSRSISPERNPGALYQKIDPLLANLSPESTLHALTSTEAVPSNEKFAHDALSRSISQVSPADRALGIRAAIAAQNLDLWYKEVRSWTWPREDDAMAGKGFLPPTESSVTGNAFESKSGSQPGGHDVEYYGSLPADVVEEYEQRIEEIRDGMDNLNVEELKEHVLNAHIPSRSRPSSSTSTASVPPPLTYVQLSDFTAVVTATILRALPCLSRLNSLLSTWDVRLLVLRQIPGLLRELRFTRSALDDSFHALRTTNPSASPDATLSESYIRAEHAKLESAVVAVGRRMDRALDSLEGRMDSLPEAWIDELERLEADFAAWAVEAERYRLRIEWLRSREQPKIPTIAEEPEPCLEASTEKTKHGAAAAATSSEPQGPEGDSLMEAINEEVSPAEVSSIRSTEEANCEAPASSASSDAEIPSVSDLQAPQRSGSLPNETEQITQSSLNITSDDLETPHHPARTVEAQDRTVEAQEPLSPSRVPLPTTPDVENKENIPPSASLSQRVLQSPTREPKRPALGEHGTEEEVQETALPSPPAAKQAPEIAVSTDASSDVMSDIANSPDAVDGEAMSETEKESPNKLTAPVEPDNPFVVQAGPVTPVHEPDAFIQSEPRAEGHSISPVEQVIPMTGAVPSAAVETPASPVADNKSISQTRSRTESPPMATSELKPAKSRSKPSGENTLQQPGSARKPLQSPIKLSKSRPGKLSLETNAQTPCSRRKSSGSVGSLLSDNSSLLSSPDAPEPHTGPSNDQLTPDFPKSIPAHDDHSLREGHLMSLDNPKISSGTDFQHNRSVSLPLARFINEEIPFGLEGEPSSMVGYESATKVSSTVKPSHKESSTPTPLPRLQNRRPVLARGKSASDLKSGGPKARHIDSHAKAFGQNTAHRAMRHQEQPKSLRLRQRLTTHPSLESLGVKKRELAYVEEDESEMADVGSRASSPNRVPRKPRDHLDEKITSILSTLPGRVHLVDPSNEADGSSSSSSLDRRIRDKFLSESPHGPIPRSGTPAPSLTLMPAAQRRLSHAHKAEDGCVKLYHLHHGGQTAPTKLFVRTVGEDGQRVMVRVGGGWADLGEYLREYVIHHGRRRVSETPRVEVQGIGSRGSPGYSPGNMLTPATLAYHSSGRATPSRPASVLSTRPPSSLTVHKARRGSNASEASAMAPRSVTTGALSSFASPPTASTGRRRLSVSSSYSFGDHSPANTVAGHSHDSHSTPLGLAGPKPRSRQISMSPEGEAWVEDVLQQTRRTSSFNPPPFALNLAPESDAGEPQDTLENDRSLPKARSVSDIGVIGTSRRVTLRGLGNRR